MSLVQRAASVLATSMVGEREDVERELESFTARELEDLVFDLRGLARAAQRVLTARERSGAAPT